jgi:hypothetical protein
MYFFYPGLLRLGEPAGELHHWVVAHALFIEASQGILSTDVGDGHNR